MKRHILVALCLLLPALASAQTQLPVETFYLPNGLKVILCEEHSQPKIYGFVVVHAGSKNENPNATGVAHYFEHIMFKGTDRIGTTNWAKEKPYLDSISQAYDRLQAASNDKQREQIQMEINRLSIAAAQYAIPNEVDAILQGMGCTGLNAGTSYDNTVYYNTLPSNQLTNWMDVYVERFRNPVFRLFQSELEAIYEEKNMYDNQQLLAFTRTVFTESFGNHPYSRDVIGLAQHLKNPQPSEMQKFFDTYYVANNMTLLLVGDFSTSEVKRLVADKFGTWRKGELPQQPTYDMPKFDSQKIQKVKQTPINMGLMVFPGVPQSSPDYLPLNMLGQLLGGNTGLLSKAATEGRLMMAQHVPLSLEDAGSNVILYVPIPLIQNHQKAEQVVWDCLDSIRQGNFSDELIEGIKQVSYMERLRSTEGVEELSQLLLQLEMEGSSYRQWVDDTRRWMGLTRQDIIDVANRYFSPDHCTLVRSSMGFPKTTPAVKPAWDHLEAQNKEAQSPFAKMIAANQPDPIHPQVIDFRRDLTIQPVTSHCNLYSTKNPYNEVFELNICYNYGLMDNPDMGRATEYMRLLGSDSLTLQQFQQALNLYGASISLSASDDHCTLTIEGLDANMDSILALCHRWLYHPHHDSKQINNIVDELKASEKTARNDSDTWFDALKQYVYYGQQSSYLRSTPYKQWGKRTGEQLHDEVMQMLSRNGHVTFSGNIDPATLAEKLLQSGLVLDSVQPMPRRAFKVQPYSQPRFFYASNRKFLQSDMAFFIPSQHFDTADRAVATLFNEYFGGGMNGIVFQEIREFRSLGYSTYARFRYDMMNLNPASLQGFLGTQCDKTEEGIEAMRDLLVAMPERPDKLAPAIANKVSALNSDYYTFREIPFAVQMWTENWGWDRDRRTDMIGQIENLTMSDLRAFHAKYIKGRPLLVILSGNAHKFNPKSAAALLGTGVQPTPIDRKKLMVW